MLSFPGLLRWATLFIVVAGAPLASAAQQRPSPQETEALLRSNPDLAAQVRTRLRDSGLTPEQTLNAVLATTRVRASISEGLIEVTGPQEAAETVD